MSDEFELMKQILVGMEAFGFSGFTAVISKVLLASIFYHGNGFL
jgi:hypothetical protein